MTSSPRSRRKPDTRTSGNERQPDQTNMLQRPPLAGRKCRKVKYFSGKTATVELKETEVITREFVFSKK